MKYGIVKKMDLLKNALLVLLLDKKIGEWLEDNRPLRKERIRRAVLAGDVAMYNEAELLISDEKAMEWLEKNDPMAMEQLTEAVVVYCTGKK